ncbi:MAG: type II toxin-antitoxin system VapC family toxin [Pseudomonadota bacterium]
MALTKELELLVDTNAYAAFKRGHPQAVDVLRHAKTIGMSNVVLGELLAGFATGKKEVENQQELNQFLKTPRVVILTIDDTTARYYANIYKQLRNKGKPIPTNDMWIAATALQHGLALLTYDKHFANVDNLLHGQQLKDFFPHSLAYYHNKCRVDYAQLTTLQSWFIILALSPRLRKLFLQQLIHLLRIRFTL